MVEPSVDAFLPTIKLVQAKVSATAAVRRAAKRKILSYNKLLIYCLYSVFIRKATRQRCLEPLFRFRNRLSQSLLQCDVPLLDMLRIELTLPMGFGQVGTSEQGKFSIDSSTIGTDAGFFVLQPVNDLPITAPGILTYRGNFGALCLQQPYKFPIHGFGSS